MSTQLCPPPSASDCPRGLQHGRLSDLDAALRGPDLAQDTDPRRPPCPAVPPRPAPRGGRSQDKPSAGARGACSPPRSQNRAARTDRWAQGHVAGGARPEEEGAGRRGGEGARGQEERARVCAGVREPGAAEPTRARTDVRSTKCARPCAGDAQQHRGHRTEVTAADAARRGSPRELGLHSPPPLPPERTRGAAAPARAGEGGDALAQRLATVLRGDRGCRGNRDAARRVRYSDGGGAGASIGA